MTQIPKNVARQFTQRLDATKATAEHAAEATFEAAGTMLSAVLKGQRIYVCAAPGRVMLAQHFAQLMAGTFEHERPGLPVIALNGVDSQIDTVAAAIRAAGGGGDVLFVIAENELDEVLPAIHSAHERDMQVVLLSNGLEEVIEPHLHTSDRLICTNSDSVGTLIQAQLLLVHTLVSLIDRQLLGLSE
ncbi:MAG TPA: SIS domain-containing protein [Halothiobacillaceae bacterium]|nr:SIS domain-containing protein [Halothiobacillaceae bacterium]